MIKARSKKVSLLLVLMMLATLFVGVGTASASTDNVAVTVPAVPTSSNGTSLGTLRITETDSGINTIATGDEITITLPSGVEYKTPDAVLTAQDNFVKGNGLDATVIAHSNKTLTVRISRSDTTKASIDFFFGDRGNKTDSLVKLDGPNADIAVDIKAPNTGISEGKVIVATSSSAGTVATVLDDSTIPNSSTGHEIGTIRISESRSGSIKASTSSSTSPRYVKVIAPSDVTITSASIDEIGLDLSPVSGYPTDNEDGYSEMRWLVNNPETSTPGFVNITLDVSTSDKDLTGPVEFTVKGDDVTTQKLTVGSIGDYDITVTAKGDPKTVRAGAANQEIQDMTLKELLKGSLLEDRDITLELPEYAHWYQGPDITVESGDATLDSQNSSNKNKTDDNQRHKLSFTVTNGSANGTKTEFTLENMKVFLDADAPAGDLDVKVSGNAINDDYDVVLAKVVAPVAVAATPTDVKLGVTAQAAGDLTITEPEAGILKYQVTQIIADDASKDFTPNSSGNDPDIQTNQAAKLIVALPDGVTFDSTPTVTVTTGDLQIKDGSVKLTNDDQYLEIPIDKTSTVASTITVSGIKLTLDRTVPEGAINAKIIGNAVDQVSDDGVFDDSVAKTAIATAVTPADQNASYTSTFVIGASTYTINGATVDAVAPSYIKNSRTYLAVRDVAHALGIPDTNVLWDQTNYTVTLIKGDKVVQMKIGSNVLTVNGATITMDVAPEITADRTFLPAAWLAQAFGYSATFDAATQTVTIK